MTSYRPTHGFSLGVGFLTSSISPDMFLRKRLWRCFSSMSLSLRTGLLLRVAMADLNDRLRRKVQLGLSCCHSGHLLLEVESGGASRHKTRHAFFIIIYPSLIPPQGFNTLNYIDYIAAETISDTFPSSFLIMTIIVSDCTVL